MPLGGKITPARRKDKRAAAKFFVIHRKKGSLTEPFVFSGGPSGNRTPNLLIKSQLLCLVELTARLSVCLIILGGPKKVARPAGFEPATCGFEVRRSIRAELRAHKRKTGLLIGNRFLIVKVLSQSAQSFEREMRER